MPIWILGSSLFGAQLAAQLGLPYAFASHFAPGALEEASSLYRHRFTPGKTQTPHFMMAVNVFVADTEEEARRLRTSPQQGFLNLRKGTPGPLPKPVAQFEDVASPAEAHLVNAALRITAVSTKDSVATQLRNLIDIYQPDEIMLTGMIHDHTARLKSFEMAADILHNMTP